MRFRPVFLATNVKGIKRSAPSNAYTEQDDKEKVWNVHFIHGYYVDLSMDIVYPTEEEARKEFSPWTVYGPEQIINALQNERFVVKSIRQVKRVPQKDQYSGTAEAVKIWQVAFQGDNEAAMYQYHPSESRANYYKLGESMSPLELFGSLPLVPIDVSNYLRELADDAREAAEAAAKAKEEREAAERMLIELRDLQVAEAVATANLAAALAAQAAKEAALMATVAAQAAQAASEEAKERQRLAAQEMIKQALAEQAKPKYVGAIGSPISPGGFWAI